MLNYKGYIGEAVYDDDVKMFAGRIVNAKGVGTFYGKTVDELEHEFRQTIDYYIDLCKRKNVVPQQRREFCIPVINFKKLLPRFVVCKSFGPSLYHRLKKRIRK